MTGFRCRASAALTLRRKRGTKPPTVARNWRPEQTLGGASAALSFFLLRKLRD
jgi:hypothetical protein